jgi:hypothetical protein
MARAKISGHLENPLLAAEYGRWSVVFGIVSVLAAEGEGYPSLKWTAEKLDRCSSLGANQKSLYREMLRGGGDPDECVRQAEHLHRVVPLIDRIESGPAPSLVTGQLLPDEWPTPLLILPGRRTSAVIPADAPAVASLLPPDPANGPVLSEIPGIAAAEHDALLHLVRAGLARRIPKEVACS